MAEALGEEPSVGSLTENTLTRSVCLCERCWTLFRPSEPIVRPDLSLAILCGQCLADEIRDFKRQCETLTERLRDYEIVISAFEASLLLQDEMDAEEDILELKTDVDSADSEILGLHHSLFDIDRQLMDRRAELRHLRSLRDRSLQSGHFSSRTSHDYVCARSCFRSQLVSVSTELRTLNSFNVLDHVFRIDVSEEGVGRINSFRLGGTLDPDLHSPRRRHGRMIAVSSTPLEELNMAWGEAVLLLTVLSKLREHTFETYQLLPRGCRSKILHRHKSASYELFLKEPFAHAPFYVAKFNHAMEAFIHCLAEIASPNVLLSGSRSYDELAELEETGEEGASSPTGSLSPSPQPALSFDDMLTAMGMGPTSLSRPRPRYSRQILANCRMWGHSRASADQPVLPYRIRGGKIGGVRIRYRSFPHDTDSPELTMDDPLSSHLVNRKVTLQVTTKKKPPPHTRRTTVAVGDGFSGSRDLDAEDWLLEWTAALRNVLLNLKFMILFWAEDLDTQQDQRV